jgi:tartrate dehydratase alpha subunit/fumarate hydratase class I-like protein
VDTSLRPLSVSFSIPNQQHYHVGGSAEKAMLMAKESLMESIDIQDIAQKPTPSKLEKLRLELVNIFS